MFRNQKGFTLIELVIIIVALGIIASVAIPKYKSIVEESREASCRASLGGLRSGVSIYYARMAIETGTATWPEYDSLITIGTVMEQTLPRNSYCDRFPDSIVSVGPGVAKGTLRNGSRPGWVYKPSTGEIWANSNTVGENDW